MAREEVQRVPQTERLDPKRSTSLGRLARVPWRLGLLAAFLTFLAVAPWVLSPFYVTLLNFIGMYSMVTMGLVLLTGYAGLASLGQAAFMGVGAYAAAVLSSRYGVNPWLGILSGVVLSSLVAWFIGLITLRLKGHFLALATLAWGIVITGILRNWIAVTGGNTGYGIGAEQRIPVLSVFGFSLRDERFYYYLIWGCALLLLVLSLNLMRSRTGRAIKSLRTGSVAAASFGVDVAQLKMLSFVLAAAYAALAGGLFAHLFRFISPNPFDLNQSIDFLIMAVVGGLSSLWGAIFGAGLFVVFEEVLQETLPQLIGRSGNYEIIAFGFVLILVLHRARRGLLPLLNGFLPTPPPTPVYDAEPLPSRKKTSSQTSQQEVREALLELSNVSKVFGGLRAVDNLSFKLKQGAILGLIGPNGAGKTTVFNLITGVLQPSEGEVRFGGQKLSHLPPHKIARRGLARTFQHLNLIGNMSLLENVALGGYTRTSSNFVQGMLGLERRENARTRAEALRQLERVGLAENAFDTADSLPLGKQRLLEVARALMADPELLLLDEPAAGLRKHEKTELMTLIRKLQGEGITVLIVEHDMDLVMALAERIVVMNYGTKLAEGTPAEVRRNPQVLEAYLGTDE